MGLFVTQAQKATATSDGCFIVKKNLETPYPDEGQYIKLDALLKMGMSQINDDVLFCSCAVGPTRTR